MNKFLLNLYPIVSILGALFVALLMRFNPVYRHDFMTQMLLAILCMNLLVIHHVYLNMKS
jgi:hypothetical protein